MIIVIEGQRGTGKTTLCSNLASELSKLGIKYVLYKSSRTDDPHKSMVSAFGEQGIHQDTVFIWDRAHLTEWVMSIALERSEPRTLFSKMLRIDAFISSLGGHVFVLDAKTETIEKRLEIRQTDRQADIPTILAKSLWRAAYSWSEVAEWLTNDSDSDLSRNLQTIVNLILESRK